MKTLTTVLTLITILIVGVAITMGIRFILKEGVPTEPTNFSPEYRFSDDGKG